MSSFFSRNWWSKRTLKNWNVFLWEVFIYWWGFHILALIRFLTCRLFLLPKSPIFVFTVSIFFLVFYIFIISMQRWRMNISLFLFLLSVIVNKNLLVMSWIWGNLTEILASLGSWYSSCSLISWREKLPASSCWIVICTRLWEIWIDFLWFVTQKSKLVGPQYLLIS